MSLFVNNNVILGYGSGPTTRSFAVKSAYDDDIDIISQTSPVTALYQLSTIEKILSWRGVYRVSSYDLSTSDLSFLAAFVLDDKKQVTINGNNHSVNMRNSEVIDKLLRNDIRRVAADFEFEDAATTPVSTAFTPGTTNSSNFVANANGLAVQLTMNYGAGNIIRNFNVRSANSYPQRLAIKQIEFADKNTQTVTLGKKTTYNIDFGAMSWQSESDRETDWQWIRDFCCCLTKSISVYGQNSDSVVNDFSTVKFSYLQDSIYGKTLALKFVAQHI